MVSKLSQEEQDRYRKKWYGGSALIKKIMDAKYKKLSEEQIKKDKENKTFVNSYGEATKRYITSSTYERAEKRRKKQVESWFGK